MTDSLLTKEQQELLQRLMDEITGIASEVVDDYNSNPSELSGSIIEIHENNPFLKGGEDAD
jgi:hypothetical protein